MSHIAIDHVWIFIFGFLANSSPQEYCLWSTFDKTTSISERDAGLLEPSHSDAVLRPVTKYYYFLY